MHDIGQFKLLPTISPIQSIKLWIWLLTRTLYNKMNKKRWILYY